MMKKTDSPQPQSLADKRAAALRENLKRRKDQSAGRASARNNDNAPDETEMEKK